MRLGGAHLDGIVQFGYIALYLQNIACPGLFVHCIAAGGGCLIVFWDRPIRLHSLSHRWKYRRGINNHFSLVKTNEITKSNFSSFSFTVHCIYPFICMAAVGGLVSLRAPPPLLWLWWQGIAFSSCCVLIVIKICCHGKLVRELFSFSHRQPVDQTTWNIIDKKVGMNYSRQKC